MNYDAIQRLDFLLPFSGTFDTNCPIFSITHSVQVTGRDDDSKNPTALV